MSSDTAQPEDGEAAEEWNGSEWDVPLHAGPLDVYGFGPDAGATADFMQMLELDILTYGTNEYPEESRNVTAESHEEVYARIEASLNRNSDPAAERAMHQCDHVGKANPGCACLFCEAGRQLSSMYNDRVRHLLDAVLTFLPNENWHQVLKNKHWTATEETTRLMKQASGKNNPIARSSPSMWVSKGSAYVDWSPPVANEADGW